MAKPSFELFNSKTFLKGVECALINSFELFNDGILLMNNARLSRAYTLFQLSVEESGKVIFLLDMHAVVKIHENFPEIIDNKLIESYKKLEHIFYNHQPKTKYIIECQLNSYNKFIEFFKVGNDAGIIKQRDELKEDLKNIKALDDLKNHSLYTFIESEQFVKPSDNFDLDITNGIKFKALSKIIFTKSKALEYLKKREDLNGINIEVLEALKLDKSHC